MKRFLRFVVLVGYALFSLSGTAHTERQAELGCFPVYIPQKFTLGELKKCYPNSHIDQRGLFYGKDSSFKDLVLYWPVQDDSTSYTFERDLSLDPPSYRGLTLVMNQFFPQEEEPAQEENETFPGLTNPDLGKEAAKLGYIQKYHKIAVREMHKYGIPASITLAQGILESNAGQSSLAKEANNHFGIKCFSRRCSKGHCINRYDDHHKDFFRVYDSPWESYRAHSLFLKKGKRYASLFKLKRTNYRAWAHGLKKAGYATDKLYAEKLINLIEDLGLDEYDQAKRK